MQAAIAVTKASETIGELLSIDFPERDLIIGSWLAAAELVMLFAYRGVGKTFAGLTIGHRIASGYPWLNYQVPQKRRVCLFDGEMGRAPLAHRLWAIERGSQVSCPVDGMKIITYEHTRHQEMPNMANPDHWPWYLGHAKDSDVVIIDNLMTCSYALSSRDDDVQQWERVQRLLLRWRAAGKAVIVVHHAGKSFQQLGTSRRENIMDAILELRRTNLKRCDDGGCFELHFDKSRKFYGEAANPLFVEFSDVGDSIHWSFEPLFKMQEMAIAREWSHGSRLPAVIASKYNLPLYRVQEILANCRRQAEQSEEELF